VSEHDEGKKIGAACYMSITQLDKIIQNGRLSRQALYDIHRRPWIFNNDIAIIICIADISPCLFYKYIFKNYATRYEFE